jgi:thiosulfate/3-mercaptopyruvate sulfurtransferase
MRAIGSRYNLRHQINGQPTVTEPLLPLLVEPAQLEPKLGLPGLLLVDLSRPEVYAQAHLPGAIPVDYATLNAAAPPAMGLLPDAERLSATFGV